MPRIRHRLTDRGLIAFNTTGDERNEGLGPKLSNGGTISADATLVPAQAGAYVISGSSLVTVTMPSAGDCMGDTWIFRAGSVHAHQLLSGSGETTVQPFTDGTLSGGSLDLENIVGSSVVLVSDGANFIVTGVSGTLAIA